MKSSASEPGLTGKPGGILTFVSVFIIYHAQWATVASILQLSDHVS